MRSSVPEALSRCIVMAVMMNITKSGKMPSRIRHALLSGAGDVLAHPDYFYRANGYGALAALAVLFGWPLIAWQRGEAVQELRGSNPPGV